jgi:hypothetical protein
MRRPTQPDGASTQLRDAFDKRPARHDPVCIARAGRRHGLSRRACPAVTFSGVRRSSWQGHRARRGHLGKEEFMRKLIPAPLLVLVVLSFLLSVPAVARANGATVSQDTYFDFTVFNTCTNEDVHIFGTGHTVDQFNVLPDGKLHILHQENVKDTQAVGVVSGTVYNPTGQPEREVFNYDANTNSGPYSFINRQLFITPGNTDNFVLRESYHVEKTPNGDFVVIRDRFSIECRG